MFANYSPFLALSTLGSPAVCLNDDMAKFSYILARTRLAIFPLRAQHVVRMAFRTTRSQCEGYIYIRWCPLHRNEGHFLGFAVSVACVEGNNIT